MLRKPRARSRGSHGTAFTRMLSGRFLGLVAVVLFACSGQSEEAIRGFTAQGTASLEGDIYLVMASGDVKPGASVTVHLIGNVEQVLKELSDLCAPAMDEVAEVTGATEAALTRARERRALALERRANAQLTLRQLVRELRTVEDSLKAIKTMRERDGYAYFQHPTYLAAVQAVQEARAAVAAPIPSADAAARAYPTEIEAIRSRLATAVVALLMRNEIAQSKAGMDAHYRFQGVGPGTYYLFAQTSIFDTLYEWFTRVSVAADTANVQDLDNESLEHGSLYCGLR